MRSIGLCGQGAQGRGLAARLSAGARAAVPVWDPAASGGLAYRDAGELARALAPPRLVILAADAGGADALLPGLEAALAPGDAVLHAGNERYQRAPERRERLARAGIGMLDLGVGIGPEAARSGPTIMAGGDAALFDEVAPVLAPIAAVVDGSPCVGLIGPSGAGHLAKVIHLGIEYADVHILAEALDLLAAGGLAGDELAEVFEAWDEGPLASLFVQASARILRARDPETGRPMLEIVDDASQMKAMGAWFVEDALALGVPAPAIAAAIDARRVGGRQSERAGAAERLGPPPQLPAPDRAALIEDVRCAALAAKLCACAQAFDLLRATAAARSWQVDPAELARLSRAGCAIRAGVFASIQQACAREPEGMLLDRELAARLVALVPGWRRAVSTAALHGLAAPVLSAALAWFDWYRRARLPTSLIQALRDSVGGLPFRRTDRPGDFHGDW